MCYKRRTCGNHIDFSTNEPQVANSNIAEAGSLILEWATLSKHLDNDAYFKLADKAFRHLINMETPLPGMPAQTINPATGEAYGGHVTWDGGSDSYFEYLLKYPRLFNPEDSIYMDAWSTAIDSSIRHLLRRSTVGNHLYTSSYDATAAEGRRNTYTSSHLACFHGGNWLYGGTLLNNETITSYALELIDACWNTYASTATGIGPDGFAFDSPDGNYTGFVSDKQTAFYAEHGFYVTSGYYLLRPEVMESNFYAWRVTGDVKYVERARSVVESLNKYARGKVAYDALRDVTSEHSGRVDDMESFWFAEVLKYLYLTFDDPNHISIDEYIFNTEAHPFKAPPQAASYGSGRLLGHPSESESSVDEDEAPPERPVVDDSPTPWL